MTIKGTMELIDTVVIPSGGQPEVEFANIPQTYTDLRIVASLRVSSAGEGGSFPVQRCELIFNNTTTGTSYSVRLLYGNGASTGSASGAGAARNFYSGAAVASGATSNTFSNVEYYIPNYTSSNNKSFMIDSVTENNSTAADASFTTGIWSNSAAVTNLRLRPYDLSNFVEFSSVSLYGISRVPTGAKAVGGVITQDSDYWYHAFTSTGVFKPTQSLSCDVLVIAGGGGGDDGGGGAGGVLYFANQSLTSTDYTVTIGAGGNGAGSPPSTGDVSTNGNNSSFGALTAAVGGGRGRYYNSGDGIAGGSGGGAPRRASTNGTGGATNQSSSGVTTVYANAGGNFTLGTNTAGGGGGSGAAGGANTSGGNGGNGTSAFSSWGLATRTGRASGSTVYYAGGGGGFSHPLTTRGGLGGGGDGTNNSGGLNCQGAANTGSGGGGNAGGGTGNTGNGGSGIVIVRYAK